MFAFDNLPVPDVRTPLPGPRASEWLARDIEFVSPSYTRVYPLVVERGSGAVIEDVDGNRFLDFTAGIAVTNTGHCHPEVVAAIKDQAERLIHMSGTDFYYAPQIELAARLAAAAPGASPKKVFFANSGAEAIEAALKLARWHTERSTAIAFFGGFHGRTYGAMSLSGSKLVHRRGFSPLVPNIHHVPFPRDCSGCAGQMRCRCVSQVEDTLFHRIAPPDEVAAIFVEVVQGEGGYQVAPPGFLENLRKLCDKHGILLVVDEIQSGMGRTGKLFAVEHFGIEPDIICLAKGIASGLPLGAIITRADVMDWPPGSHASTFGGNPIACRAALVTLDLLEREYTANAAERGEQLRAGLRDLATRHDTLSDVRGLGLMTAVDVVHPGDPTAPAPSAREQVIQTAFHHGLLLLGCGETGLRFCPPLCVTAEQVVIALRILDEVLTEIRGAKQAVTTSESGTCPPILTATGERGTSVP
ncbi:acetyl ornithine aminotransferase family protein [Fimbriiglobus ruber]|uniref:Ornithine aminotransferase n=1 Tax=Fimbriiglobus ruber TaxID=1908690 RepID=A0A225D1D5_9BACT|nr:acetyl ornithine aminotransferase family protein [Fimbriiglobus ruber]OWK34743.1 Ornithine aminotransferase [Fimbriiglobus ruber]